ncbi:unnamed protein product [Lactuca virosa]|uniref:NAD(P)-binding domain-containing protein n=1 Tax=Lactuca virosa TaxID=75947 RepID=A0AAU9N3I7_9ASTR|nr:unnamed protein product [Lactuca virosa]
MSDSIKPSDYTSLPLPTASLVAAPLPGPLGACSSRCSLSEVAVGSLPELNVYGHDYHTKDGSVIRDYIHVMNLVDGLVAALKELDEFVLYIFMVVVCRVKYGIEEMCRGQWNWAKQNPWGYQKLMTWSSSSWELIIIKCLGSIYDESKSNGESR